MKNIPGTKLNNNRNQHDRTRVKTSPSSPQVASVPHAVSNETVLPFHFSEYPFLNTPHSSITTLKTLANFKLNPETLQQLVNISHPNIISIRKIIKTGPKSHLPYQVNYCLYYEPVQYNIKFLLQNSHQHPRLYNLLQTFDLRAVLCSVYDHLQQDGILHGIRLNDIGISLQGNIKIYIPPNAIVDPKHNPHLHKAFSSVVQWWDCHIRSISNNPFKKRVLQPPKLIDNKDLELQDASMDEYLQKQLEDLLDDSDSQPKITTLSDLKGSTQSLSKIGSVQLQKINKIDQQIKYFRQKLNQTKPKQKINDTNDPLKRTDKKSINKNERINSPPKQTEQKPKQINDKYYYHEPIQQNINCINIYNHNNNHNNQPNLNINPNRYTAVPNYYAQQYQQYLPRNTYGDKKYLEEEQVYEDQDSYSQDTYDIQFQHQPQYIPVNTPSRGRIFSPSERDLSEHHQSKPKLTKIAEFRSKPNANQVCNKNYTESAGPLQFKSFLNKYLKQPTKQQQPENQPQKQHETYQQPSLSNFNTQSMRSLNIGLKSPLKPTKIRGSYQADKSSNIKRNYSQNQFQQAPRLNNDNKQIQSKVKQALQKTKNAIALLNRVKKNRISSKNISMK